MKIKSKLSKLIKGKQVKMSRKLNVKENLITKELIGKSVKRKKKK